jgi:hypothetical protein
MRRMLAAEIIGEVDHARRLRRDHCRHHVVELADIAAHHLHLLSEIAERRGTRVDVHADDFFAALRQ